MAGAHNFDYFGQHSRPIARKRKHSKLKCHGSSALLQDNLTVDKCTLEDRLARTHNSDFFVYSIFGHWVRSNARISKPPACKPAPLPRRSGQRPPGSAAALSHRLMPTPACREAGVPPASLKLLFKASAFSKYLRDSLLLRNRHPLGRPPHRKTADVVIPRIK